MADAVSRQDVIEGYRLLLARDPENEAVIKSHLGGKPSLWTFLKTLTESPEARRYQLDRASSCIVEQQGVLDVDVEATAAELAELTGRLKAAWSALGAADPYWSVLTSGAYRTEAITEQAREQFYSTGADELQILHSVCAHNGINCAPDATVCELGCGVGRIGEHFARTYGQYIGVDVSETHLKIARQRFSSQALANTVLMSLQKFLRDETPYDIFYSVLSLQHSPPPVMLTVLNACFSRIRAGGLAFFQLPCHLYDYRFRLAEYLTRPRRERQMELHALPQAYVFRALAEHGLVPVEVVPFPRIGPIGFSYAFLAKKPGLARKPGGAA